MAMLGLLLGTVAGATFSGRMIPRFVHYKRIAMIGVSLAIVSIGLLSAIAGHASLLEVEILTTLIGLGSGTTFPVATVSVQNAVDRTHLGVATGVLTFLRTLGGALGVAMLGAVALGYGLPLSSEGSQTPIQLTSALPFVMIFLTAGITLVLALIVLFLMPEKALRGRDEHAAPVLAE
jgi:MFS family permease